MPNAIEILVGDHKNVRDLLSRLVETTNRAKKTRGDLLDKIRQELSVHTTIEEELFYPAFRDCGGKEHKRMYFEAFEEHRAVEKLVLPDLKKADVASDQFAGRAKVLKELVEHHIKEEEEGMFDMAAKAMSEEELEDLGRKMAARKRELL